MHCFGQSEWDSIRQAYHEVLPEMLRWEEWCGEDEQPVQLPSGDRVSANRGAGQGEPDGPLKAAVTIGWCVVLSLIPIFEPTRLLSSSYAVCCL